jgi:hypothetical protein
MTNKVEKNNVDDYYKKTASNNDKTAEKKPVIKKSFKVRAKKKVFIKKDNSPKKPSEPKTAEQIQASVDRRVANLNKKFANNKEQS